MAGTIALGTLAFDGGSTAAPATGVVITATSGATGVVHVVTVSTGAWGDNNVTGTITLGSCTGLFNDNEAVTWAGGSCTINHPDGAVGADGFVENGAFVHDNDPPADWTARNSATLSTEAGGQVGNCLKILENGADNPGVRQTISVTAGKIYKFSFYHKDIDGTSDDPYYSVYNVQAAGYISGPTTETANAAWTQVTHTFGVPVGCTSIYLSLHHPAGNGDADAYYFDEASLYLLGSGGGGSHYMFMDMKL